jgi:hypothetical protein
VAPKGETLEAAPKEGVSEEAATKEEAAEEALEEGIEEVTEEEEPSVEEEPAPTHEPLPSESEYKAPAAETPETVEPEEAVPESPPEEPEFPESLPPASFPPFEPERTSTPQGAQEGISEPSPVSRPEHPREPRHPSKDQPVSPAAKAEIGLLDYLLSLSKALPEEKRKEFLHSEYLLKIEFLKNRLAGYKGFLKDKVPLEASPPKLIGPLPKSKVKKTLSFLTEMAQFYPNPDAAQVLKEKIYRVLEKIPNNHNKEPQG